MKSSNGRAIRKKMLIGTLLVIIIGGGIFFMLSKKDQDAIMDDVGLETGSDEEGPQSYVSVRNVTSRKAVIGDGWVIKGKLFNTHEEKTFEKIKLMFNFSDGVETAWINKTLRPDKEHGIKFKEKVDGHGDAEFKSIEVLEVKE